MGPNDLQLVVTPKHPPEGGQSLGKAWQRDCPWAAGQAGFR